MSTQLAALGVDVIEGYEPDQLALKPDVFVVGNVMSRGNALVEAMLDSGAPLRIGPGMARPQRAAAGDRWVLGVAGTHGKTTTSEPARVRSSSTRAQQPGFLIGGVPLDFGVSARLGDGRAVRDRGRRVRHRVLRQAREVRPLPAAHRDPEQPRARPRRHLPGRRVDPAPVPPAAAHDARATDGCVVNAEEPQPRRSAATGVLDAGRTLRHASGRARPTGACAPIGVGGDYRELRGLARRAAASAASTGELLGRHNAANALAALVAAHARGRRGSRRRSRRCAGSAASSAGSRCAASSTASSSTTTSRTTRPRSRRRCDGVRRKARAAG